ncbi:hypothetical protein FPV67DRAFT_992390 [Lyophyllum atratum]|nr:hypothetical protein FPV67DRAFT_992390 [Lyophyllum atratum]
MFLFLICGIHLGKQLTPRIIRSARPLGLVLLFAPYHRSIATLLSRSFKIHLQGTVSDLLIGGGAEHASGESWVKEAYFEPWSLAEASDWHHNVNTRS